MTYFLILIVIALIVSPIVALRSSPHQKKQERLRRRAQSEGIAVQLVRRPDARDDETSLDSVHYRLSWGQDAPDEIKPWTLVHNSARGMESEWPGWHWFEGPASSALQGTLTEVIAMLPAGVTGLKVDRNGLALHWDESGEESDVEAIINALHCLRSAILL